MLPQAGHNFCGYLKCGSTSGDCQNNFFTTYRASSGARPTTTHHYVETDLTIKERALARFHEPEAKIQRYRAPDSLIDYLKTL